MLARSVKVLSAGLVAAVALWLPNCLRGDDAGPEAAPEQPKGVTVLARGPVHEAFATLTTEPAPTKPVPKKPPKAIEELPPDEKPDGDVLWIGGYWAWDDDRKDFLWVSGVWRSPPPNKQWVAGYWREEGDGWQWVAGFWTTAPAKEDAPQDVTYLPPPPPPPDTAAPGAAPAADTFYVPGYWVWTGSAYAWRAGYWAKVKPDLVWVSAHYIWTPSGYIYVSGYWDYTIKRRGVLYAPVVIDTEVVGAAYVYTPAYAVQDTVVVDALFVRPSTCHYYFGDYYDPCYHDAGFESCVVYSRSHYDSIIVYERWDHRSDPEWINVQVNVYNDRVAGRAPVPPRTLVQQTTVVNNVTVNNTTNVNTNTTNINKSSTNINNTNVTVNKQVSNVAVLAPAAKVMAAHGSQVVKLDAPTRQAAKQQAVAVQEVAVQRTKTEVAVPGGAPKQARIASLNVPAAKPLQTAAVAPSTQPPAGTVNPKTGQPTVNAMNPVGGAKPNTGPVVTNPPAAKPPVVTTPTGQPGANPATNPVGGARPNTGPVVTNPPPAAKPPVVNPAAPTKTTIPGTITPVVNTQPTPKPAPSGPPLTKPDAPTTTTTKPLTTMPPGQAPPPGTLSGPKTPVRPPPPPPPPPAKRPPPKDKDKQDKQP